MYGATSPAACCGGNGGALENAAALLRKLLACRRFSVVADGVLLLARTAAPLPQPPPFPAQRQRTQALSLPKNVITIAATPENVDKYLVMVSRDAQYSLSMLCILCHANPTKGHDCMQQGSVRHAVILQLLMIYCVRVRTYHPAG